MDIHVQEAQRVPNKISPKRPTPRHSVTKTAKVKERSPKEVRKKKRDSYKGISIRLSAYFSTETVQARREGQDICKALKGKHLQPSIFYAADYPLE